MGLGSWLSDKLGLNESQSTKDKREDLDNQGGMSSWFADQGQVGFGRLGGEADALRQQLGRYASGEDSVSREALRQGLQQNLSAQRSMAASASPGNAAMAARNAAMNMGRLGYGMSGQAAMTGLQEKRDATNALAQMLMQQRQQELQAALGARQNAISAFGGITPKGSGLEEKAMPLINAGIGLTGAILGRKG